MVAHAARESSLKGHFRRVVIDDVTCGFSRTRGCGSFPVPRVCGAPRRLLSTLVCVAKAEFPIAPGGLWVGGALTRLGTVRGPALSRPPTLQNAQTQADAHTPHRFVTSRLHFYGA